MSKSGVMNRMARSRRKSAGFTILEVLVAMAILAIAGVAVVRSTSQHISAISTVKEVTFSSWVAENRMVELQLDNKWPPSNNKKGKMEMAGREWHWRQKVEKVTDKSMRQVTVHVFANENDEESIYQLTMFLGDPK